ncbi:MAG: 16S rRNA (guanine(966)-N(2))-methyltransferase RsmD [Methylophagaceae bacterium]
MAKQNKTKQSGVVRLIAGKWRGRRLNFPDCDGLRPTPDRVRETLFNWLQSDIGDAQCLDLFAGSGALGFEAASRGADSVTMIESNPEARLQLKLNSGILSADNCRVKNMTAQQFLAANSTQYDIVFIDPPYQAELWQAIIDQLVETSTLKDGAKIYLECSSKKDLPHYPHYWQLIKDKKAGEVRYCLFLHDMGAIG